MRNFLTAARAAFAVSISGLLCCAAAAAATPQASSIDLAVLSKIVGAQKSQAAAARTQSASKLTPIVAAPGTAQGSETFANEFRAYPPSCLNSPLPFGLWQADPNALQAQVTLPGDPISPDADEQRYTEVVTITAFRVICTSGLSATLVEIDRSSNGSNGLYPIVPSITVTQGNITDAAIRVADDPNTFFSAIYAGSPLYASDVFILENYYSPSLAQFNYNQAFTLTVNNLITTDPHGIVTFTMPQYGPPANPVPLPISGYMSSAWYDPAHSGEGMMIQVFEDGNTTTRTFFAAWYTYNTDGTPVWLSAQLDFPIISAGQYVNALTNVPTYYVTGGAFAGGPKATANNWGTMSFSFPDCNTLSFSFNGSTGTQIGPSGSGIRTWKRLANINSLVCK